MNWYKIITTSDKKAQKVSTDFEDMFGDDFFSERNNTQKNIIKKEEKTKNVIITLFRNFDANLNEIEKDKNGNLILSPEKCEQGVLWFSSSLQNNPEQYYDRGKEYLLTYPLSAKYHYTETTYNDGSSYRWPISDNDPINENSSSWAGYELPDGFKFSYKVEKHIICEKPIIINPNNIKKVNNELV